MQPHRASYKLKETGNDNNGVNDVFTCRQRGSVFSDEPGRGIISSGIKIDLINVKKMC